MIEIQLTGSQQSIQLALCRLRQAFAVVTPTGRYIETAPHTFSLKVIAAF